MFEFAAVILVFTVICLEIYSCLAGLQCKSCSFTTWEHPTTLSDLDLTPHLLSLLHLLHFLLKSPLRRTLHKSFR
jgi:hypothetical protein